MFTGLIEDVGRLERVDRMAQGMRLYLNSALTDQLELGDSVAVNGICLTVVERRSGGFSVDVAPETLSRTNLGSAAPGLRVNLERALTLGTPLSGHLVQGHVDGTGRVASLRKQEGFTLLTVEADEDLLLAIVPKGSVALDGISLTVASLRERDLTISVIPHTLRVTTLGERRPGDVVNLEVDIIGKYVYRYLASMQGKPAAGGGDEDLLKKLSEGGFI